MAPSWRSLGVALLAAWTPTRRLPRAPGTASLGCLAVQEDDLPKIYKKLEPRRDDREKKLSQGAR